MISKITKRHLIGLSLIICQLSFSMMLTSCDDMLDTDSELVEYEKDNQLNQPTDSVYSVMGIVNQMQLIADRLVLLGEVRSDLVTTTGAASADLKRLATFDFAADNVYNRVSDFYAVINNCNYFLAHIDTTLERRGHVLFRNEYAAVKAFRAWTYLELAKAYGQVPLVVTPVMTEREAESALHSQRRSLTEICDYFIADLAPYADVANPSYGAIGNFSSSYFFIPKKVLLGDLCLWAGHYEDAARWYNAYLNDKDRPVTMNKSNRICWTSVADFQHPSDAYSVLNEYLSFIPMESRVFNGTITDLDNIFNSTSTNNYFYQLEPSQAIRQLSSSQINCIEYKTPTSTDTVYAPRTGLTNELLVGDLRLYSNYSLNSSGAQNSYSEYSSTTQTIMKQVSANRITTYRNTMVYLRYAEALNRAGLPQSAMAVLKYGLCAENINAYIDSLEQAKAGDLIKFDESYFTRENTTGIHSRGSGDSQCNAFYVLPQPQNELATRQDTINYQIPLVEDMIIDEMALEGAFEGYRLYDLMRVALRRGDPAYLADPISHRNGQADDQLRTLLMDQKNWYLPLP